MTNNASESMNAVLRRLQQWKQVPLDVIVISLHHLSVYYRREVERSMHQCGQWVVKNQFDHLKREPSLMPYMDVAPDPKEIVEMVRKGEHNVVNERYDESMEVNTIPKKSLSLANSDIVMAIANNRVKLVDDGAWIVLESDRVSASAVKLFPKETCSCPTTRTCYHITACRLMVGLPPCSSGKTNLAEMQCNDRKRRERPAGRKQPRRCDFANATKKDNNDKRKQGKYTHIFQ